MCPLSVFPLSVCGVAWTRAFAELHEPVSAYALNDFTLCRCWNAFLYFVLIVKGKTLNYDSYNQRHKKPWMVLTLVSLTVRLSESYFGFYQLADWALNFVDLSSAKLLGCSWFNADFLDNRNYWTEVTPFHLLRTYCKWFTLGSPCKWGPYVRLAFVSNMLSSTDIIKWFWLLILILMIIIIILLLFRPSSLDILWTLSLCFDICHFSDKTRWWPTWPVPSATPALERQTWS